MAAFALPVRRGDFLYSSVLYADTGNGNHHPRATVAELASLLRPEMRSKDKIPTKTKDRVGHWYTAQLIHYGMPSTKDKNTAKVRLLNALNSFKLEDADNRKLRKHTKSAKGVEETVGAGTRATVPEDMNVTVNISLSSSTSMIEQNEIEVSSNIMKISRKGSADKRKRDNTSNSKVKTLAQSITSPKSSSQWTPPRKSTQKSPRKRARFEPEANTEASPLSRTQHARKHIKQEAKACLPVARSSSHVKDEPQDQDCDPEYISLSGLYSITCPDATGFFESRNPSSINFTLLRDNDREVWWARFTLGAWDILIQMDPGPDYNTLGQRISLGWRMRDLETGELKFGRGCNGDLGFYEDQTLHGYLFRVPDIGTVEFWGPRIGGVSVADGNEYQAEWESFVEEAYGN